MTIAIVGNGPSALSFSVGEEIDKCDRVIRFNNYVIEGFESFVGRREDIWCMSGSGMVSRRTYEGEVWIPMNTRNPNNKPRIEKLIRSNKYKNIHLIPEKSCEAANVAVGLKNNQWCTSGIYALWEALRMKYSVVVHGFDFFEGQKVGEMAQHYFSHSKDERIGGRHDLMKERQFFLKLLKEKRIGVV